MPSEASLHSALAPLEAAFSAPARGLAPGRGRARGRARVALVVSAAAVQRAPGQVHRARPLLAVLAEVASSDRSRHRALEPVQQQPAAPRCLAGVAASAQRTILVLETLAIHPVQPARPSQPTRRGKAPRRQIIASRTFSSRMPTRSGRRRSSGLPITRRADDTAMLRVRPVHSV